MTTVIKFYHATNSNPNDVMRRPKIRGSVNGPGFYMTRDPMLAKQWGVSVICFEVPVGFEVDTVRPIDLSYQIGERTFEECMKSGLEHVITSHKTMREFLIYMEDCYVLDA